MKKLMVFVLVACSLGFSMAQVQENEFYEIIESGAVVILPAVRSCEDPNLGATEDCWTNRECPYPSYNKKARYCKVKGEFKFYRCGWICESPYTPGGN